MAVEVVAVEVVAVDSRNTCSKLNHRENTMDMQNTSALPDADGSERTLKEAIQALAAMIGTLQRREHALDDLVRQQLQLLQIAVKHADQRVIGVVENALPRLTQLSQQALTQSLEPAAERFNKKMATAEQTVQQATQRYAHAQHSLETTTTRRMWIASFALLVSGVLSVIVAGYALYSTKAAIAEATQRRSEVAYLDRVAHADLVPCGVDRLCAAVEKKSARYGKQGEYRVIALRPSSQD
ncbi:hypothetical protein VDF98_13225 [Xanthomonas campestris pv. raphani]|uniref:hypothetical protein n=1 Tax=Xanthomonas campestris TaxID=339 RepID=UPI0023689411|nr:hypothetical protein [Xanthomonas campestris]MEA9824580.1 hypothetical protein [Xanthomonas campestris pv. raphani]MEA9852998.1 hypothetical protein [Xanthomonas campestris pv. raphani]MEA9856892.1 hypothetical protein [Xanthomonas campestris pv. raphani]MEA9966032.1 hypothetical protein [Xanthomonas campestris pv. raphani]WDJ24590.1 hypothetical protein JH270_19705 [Xanthomonas campestris pv. raphani]